MAFIFSRENFLYGGKLPPKTSSRIFPQFSLFSLACLYITNVYVEIIGVFMATLWVSGTHWAMGYQSSDRADDQNQVDNNIGSFREMQFEEDSGFS
jgi:hypothetical protein